MTMMTCTLQLATGKRLRDQPMTVSTKQGGNQLTAPSEEKVLVRTGYKQLRGGPRKDT